MKTERLIGILYILLKKERITAKELAERFEVSRRTISRDIQSLSIAGIPICSEAGNNGGIYLMKEGKVNFDLFNKSELNDILAGLRALDSVNKTETASKLMERLSGSSDFMQGDQYIFIDLSSWYKDTLSPKINIIRLAIEKQLCLSFNYYAPGRESKRLIEPYYLVFKWSSWYIWGWCTLRKDFRLFKLNRMEELEIGDSFKKREVPMPDLSNERIFPGGIRVKILFDPSCRFRLIEDFGINSFTEEPDGTLLFQADYSDKENLISWLLTFRDKAELIEPEEIRIDIQKIIENLSRQYFDKKE